MSLRYCFLKGMEMFSFQLRLPPSFVRSYLVPHAIWPRPSTLPPQWNVMDFFSHESACRRTSSFLFSPPLRLFGSPLLTPAARQPAEGIILFRLDHVRALDRLLSLLSFPISPESSSIDPNRSPRRLFPPIPGLWSFPPLPRNAVVFFPFFRRQWLLHPTPPVP